MKALEITTDPEVELLFNKYNKRVRQKLLNLRRIILETANESEEIKSMEETLKWGEPSYLVKNGSTLRIDWKEKKPEQYAMYFKCTSKLVPTFKAIYQRTFEFEGNRAIVFQMNAEIPKAELKNCIRIALTYHKVKHLPLLGMDKK
ncbi:MAG: DUF1801 domain-containing protein [Bacteroidetes bacterium]|nr:DUF1801 domain-containing protein [Bacteroidota bacterium]